MATVSFPSVSSPPLYGQEARSGGSCSMPSTWTTTVSGRATRSGLASGAAARCSHCRLPQLRVLPVKGRGSSPRPPPPGWLAPGLIRPGVQALLPQ